MHGAWISFWLLWCIIAYLSEISLTQDVIHQYEPDYEMLSDEPQFKKLPPDSKSSASQPVDTRRPIWNIAHMVNDIPQVNYYLDQGANGIEADIYFTGSGTATHTYHGVPCDCFRSCTHMEEIVTFLKYMRQITCPGTPQYRKQFALLMMDMKIQGLYSDERKKAGVDIANKLLEHYWERGSSNASVYILVSVPSHEHKDFIDSFKKTLSSSNVDFERKIGFDFSANEDLDELHTALENANITAHIWQGDGITNCLPRKTTRLKEAIRRRDDFGKSYINKVYWWTVDKMATMRSTLRLGVDGMITNYPERLVSVLSESDISSQFRLANINDNPWTTHTYKQASYSYGGFKEDEDEVLFNC